MKKYAKRLILILIALWFVLLSTPYIYTAPVITNNNIKLINDCITLFKNTTIDRVTRWDVCTVDGIYIADRIKHIKNIDTVLLNNLMKQLKKSEFYKIVRYDDFILFFTLTHHFSTIKYGLCYSPENMNPNDSEQWSIARYKPYIELAPSWYISQELAMKARVLFIPNEIPKDSLIDHSKVLPKNWKKVN